MCLAAAMVLPAALAGADEVYVGRLPYRDVRVSNAREFTLFFQVQASGRTLSKPLTEVALIEIDRQNDFNRAEKLVDGREDQANWDVPGALRLYDAALTQRTPDWLKRLIRYRKLRALGGSDRIDQAVEAWLGLVQDEGVSEAMIAAKPTELAAKGSPANTRAINLLKPVYAQATEKLKSATGDLLLRLYQRQGMEQEAAKLAGQIVTTNGASDNGGSGDNVPASSDRLERKLRAQSVILQGAISSKDARKIEGLISDLQGAMNSFTEKHLPEALYLLARAQYERILLSGQADKTKLAEAGLNAMRVAAYFPGSPRAPDALVLAGRVNQALGNSGAAAQAYEEVLNQYSQSDAADTAKQAKAQLK
ncbi:MAG: tetratricopeptide repeat protein [Planctomycetota bacterium]